VSLLRCRVDILRTLYFFLAIFSLYALRFVLYNVSVVHVSVCTTYIGVWYRICLFVSNFPTVPLPCNTTCMQSTCRPILLVDSTSLKDRQDLKIKVADLLCTKYDLPSLLGLVD
jgi:hypothetical protein